MSPRDYRILSATGTELGTFAASSPDAALDAWARRHGHGSHRDAVAANVGAGLRAVAVPRIVS